MNARYISRECFKYIKLVPGCKTETDIEQQQEVKRKMKCFSELPQTALKKTASCVVCNHVSHGSTHSIQVTESAPEPIRG